VHEARFRPACEPAPARRKHLRLERVDARSSADRLPAGVVRGARPRGECRGRRGSLGRPGASGAL